MSKRLKYFGIYTAGYLIFLCAMSHAFDIDATGDWHKGIWMGLIYFIANMAGDIERVVRNGDAK